MSKFYRFRSSITGLFVSAVYALLHPLTTYRDMMTRKDKGQ